MPLYVYKCEVCEETVEKLQAFEAAHPDCEKCSKQMKRQIAATNFSLKGPGWARDNYGLKGG